MSVYQVVSADEFLSHLKGEWRFVSKVIERIDIIKEAKPIKKIVIVPTCSVDGLYYFNNKEEKDKRYKEISSNIIRSIGKLNTGENISILIIGRCCGVRKEAVNILNGLVPSTINFIDARAHGLNEEYVGLGDASLKEKVMEIAEGLRYFRLMQKRDWF